nr:MAG TPA: HepA-related protein (HARP) [Caudoviricetes sp.]
MINVEIVNGKALITSPYNADFVARIKKCGGRWDSAKRVWAINAEALEVARTAMMDVYGETDVTPAGELVTLVIKFGEDCESKSRQPLMVAGRVIARAFGRDSGATLGEDVAFITGGPNSGGSNAHWLVTVAPGSICEVYNFNRLKADEAIADPPRGMEITIKSAKIDAAALKAEREKLLARLAEIDKLLAENGMAGEQHA